MMAISPGELRERILQTAVERFRERGYASVPVSEITREAGVAKGTFFNYFPSRDHLLSELFHRIVNGAFGDVSGLGLAGTDAVLAFAHALLAHLARDRALSEPMILRLSTLPPPEADIAPNGPLGSAEPVRDTERIRTWIEARLSEALPVAVPLAEPDETTLAFALAWCLRGTLEDWARGVERPEALHQTTERRLSFLLESAGLPPSRGTPHPETHDPISTP